MTRTIALLAAALSLACTLASAAYAVTYQAISLPSVSPYGDNLLATSINNSGQVLLTTATHEGYHGSDVYLWDASRGITEICSGFFYAEQIDDRGNLAGYREDYSDWPPNYTTYATVRYGSTGQLVDLPTPTGADWAAALSINTAGEVVGTAGFGDFYEPVLWHTDGTSEILSSTVHSYATPAMLNNSDTVVWTDYCLDYLGDGVHRWDRDHGDVRLQGLSATDWTRALAVNDLGQILGTSGESLVLWNADNSIVDISSRFPENSVAFDLGNQRQIVGALSGRATIWNPDGSLTDLGDLPGGNGSAGYAINDAGQVIGWSYVGDETCPTLWTPVPEPSSLLALLAGLGGCGELRRRKLR